MHLYPSFIIFCIISSISLPVLRADPPDPDPATVQPLFVNRSPPATIPAFPEQSNLASCPLDLSDELLHAVKTSCGGRKLHRGRCCPVLAAWLYSAYSATALGRNRGARTVLPAGRTPAYDLPVLPDDSETCVDGVGKAFKQRGLEIAGPNETCDVVYCYCGIRLHHLSCPDAFRVGDEGKLFGDESVKRLERDCLSSGSSGDRFPGLGGCSKCLNSLYKLNYKKASDPSKTEERATRMHNKDCELMGLTWLLAKNQTAYMHTVSSVLQAIMASPSGSYPQSCTLGSDGMPLAVDSSEISNQSLSIFSPPPRYLSVLSLYLTWLLLHYLLKFN